jgi:hypothetical protein
VRSLDAQFSSILLPSHHSVIAASSVTLKVPGAGMLSALCIAMSFLVAQ